jgi:hypothetical protein
MESRVEEWSAAECFYRGYKDAVKRALQADYYEFLCAQPFEASRLWIYSGYVKEKLGLTDEQAAYGAARSL